jgi:Yip1-like protein
MADTAQSLGPPPIPKQPSEISRLLGVFVSPKSTFEDVARRPRWWIPMILMMIITAVFLGLFTSRVGWERTTRQAIEQSSNTQQLSAQQREQIIQRGAQVAQYAGYLGALAPALFMLVTAAILIFVIDSLMGGEIGFNRMMGLVGYSSLPGIISTGLAILVMYLKNPEDFDINNPLAFNAAILIPEGSARWMTVLAGAFDLFSFWRIALLALGIAAAAPRIRFGKAFIVVLTLWAVVVAIRTGLAAAFG